MPIYEYECQDCLRVEEVLQKISAAPLTRCRSCSGKLHKLISHSSFHLKGTGWYVTDYSNKSKSSDTSSPSETKTEAKKAETKTDSSKTADAAK